MKYPDALILKPSEPDHWCLGGGSATERFGGEDINPSGDWIAYKCSDEDQKRLGFESMNCTNYGTIKAWVMLAKFYGFSEFMQNASERYTGVHTNTTIIGNDPHHVAEVIREDCGLVPDSVMPWTDDIDTWDEYYNRSFALSLYPMGHKLLDRFELGHEWVFPYGNKYTPKQKQDLIRTALKRGTVCVSVKAWSKSGKYYTKSKGAADNHWVPVLSCETRPIIHDQYSPFVKELDKDYDFNAAKVYFLKRKNEVARNFWSTVWDNFKELWSH